MKYQELRDLCQALTDGSMVEGRAIVMMFSSGIVNELLADVDVLEKQNKLYAEQHARDIQDLHMLRLERDHARNVRDFAFSGWNHALDN